MKEYFRDTVDLLIKEYLKRAKLAQHDKFRNAIRSVSVLRQVSNTYYPGEERPPRRDFAKRLADVMVLRDHLRSDPLKKENLWWRVRDITNIGRQTDLAQLIYKKTDVDLGRANIPGKSVLYASRNCLTALTEVHAKPGKVYQAICVRPKTDNVFPYVIGDFSYLIQSGMSQYFGNDTNGVVDKAYHELGPVGVMAHSFSDELLFQVFGKAVEPNFRGIPGTYIISSIISEFCYILSRREMCIMYPSVHARGGMNIAITNESFDKNWAVAESQVLQVHENLGYGVMLVEMVSKARSISGMSIIWF